MISLWDNVTHTNICIMEDTEGADESKELNTFVKEIMMKNLLNLVKDMDI